MKAVRSNTTESGAPSGPQNIELGDKEQQSEVPLDDYVLDLEQGDFNVDDLYSENETPSTSKGIVKDPLGEEMFPLHSIRHSRNAERCPLDHVGKFIK
ncbi:hypothetical protein NDU88_001811 [Pleurodeles waltl]|uniref:Uncharacterized protein n=1 Tax=Pleurodeles waltl TaxID=8319 RepID=A0AAV7LMN3_PLEWA|nr:hypothetical protein NDU88_001811 [Pleurodeles waltl]